LSGKLSTTIKKLFQTRDELSFQNIRVALWPVLLVFPLSVIVGDLRYFDLGIAVAGFQSYELMLFPLGLGWLVLFFVPKKLILPLLQIAAACSALLLPFQFLLTDDMGQLAFFMAFQLFSGICTACAFFVFCFELNNVERLLAMSLIQFYYGFYYTIWRALPAVQAAGKTWAAAILVALYLVVVFACIRQKYEGLATAKERGKNSEASFVIGLSIVYYMIMCMINYIEWAETSVSSMMFGLGAFASVAAIIIIQLLKNHSALYIWLLFLALSLFGVGILILDSPVTRNLGSFTYGLGDGLGYIIIYYLCAGAIKKSKSLKMLRLFCFVLFLEYFFISGIFALALDSFVWPNHYLAFCIVLILCSVCILLSPLMQKKLFSVDWSDGLHLRDNEEYTQPLAETEALNLKEDFNLTDREEEVFTMLLARKVPKEIACTLKVSYETVRFHAKNLYRKLNIHSRVELFAKYLPNHIEKPNLIKKQ